MPHLSVAVPEDLVENVTELPANDGTFLQTHTTHNAPEEGTTLLLVGADQYHCERRETGSVEDKRNTGNESEGDSIASQRRGERRLTSNVLLFDWTFGTGDRLCDAGNLNNTAARLERRSFWTDERRRFH